ncbi:CACTA en-spm transposon protein [Cucumis melo var. makuwa]|uniref:CACTA en-spm transposon protein n=1 Tax=Cucumis melo var. makuwa TaxID=1194695 RepID=A0A5A7TT86_CUCMM|nr:CACTA en-spm transposon protein [Cucumis melo var. makuwa]
METDDMFLQFEDDLENIVGGSSSVGDNTAGSSSQQTTPTPRRRAQSRLLELECYVAINERIPMTIAPGAEKPISPHAVRFSQVIGVCVRKTFPARCLKWADVGREYIEVVKGDLQLAERRGQPVDRVELFRETHVRAGTFVSQAVEDAHNQMLELQSQPTPDGSQPPSEDEICDQVLGRRPGYSKGLGWGPKPKARRTASASSSSRSCSQSTEKEIELQAKLHEALERIEVQDRNHQALASQVEAMKKIIEELTRAQQEPPYDP